MSRRSMGVCRMETILRMLRPLRALPAQGGSPQRQANQQREFPDEVYRRKEERKHGAARNAGNPERHRKRRDLQTDNGKEASSQEGHGETGSPLRDEAGKRRECKEQGKPLGKG